MTDTPTFSSRRFVIAGLIALAILLGGVGRWMATVEIAGAVVATGSVKVEQNRQVIQHLDGGIVDQILVTEGSAVAENQPLLRLDATELATEQQIIDNRLAEVLARKSRLEAERDGAAEVTFDPLLAQLAEGSTDVAALVQGQERLYQARAETLAARKTQLGKRIEQIADQIAGIDAQQAAMTDQLALIEEELVNQQTLLKQGLAQASRVLGLQREKARLNGSRGELIANKSRAQGQITEINLEILALDTRRREEAITMLRDVQIQVLDLTERRHQVAQRLDRLEVRAPMAGVVYGLTVFAQKSVVRPAAPLMYVIPQNQPLTVEIKVLPADIEQLFVGQHTHLKLTSFSQRTTPDLDGTIKTISADTFQDERSGLQYYLIEIAINAGETAKLPKGAVLLPGMPVEAFIETVSRTPLEYLIQPFTVYLDRAFRET